MTSQRRLKCRTAVLTATIRMEKAARWRIAEAHSHVQRPDCQILLHSVTDRPAHNAAAMQIEDDGKVLGPGDLVFYRDGTEHHSYTPNGCLLAVHIAGPEINAE